MKIILTTDETKGRIWSSNWEILKPYSENLIVVSFDKNNNRIEGANYVDCSMFEGRYYERILKRLNEINSLLEEGEDVLILGDIFAESLYVLKVLQHYPSKDINIHLWAIKPCKIDGKEEVEKYNYLLEDLSNINSVTLTEPVKYIIKNNRGSTLLSERFAVLSQLIKENFDNHLKKIFSLGSHDRFFYDYQNEIFVSVNDVPFLTWSVSYDDMDKTSKKQNDLIDKIKQPVPRANGKEICRKLRELRKAFAEANNRPYDSVNCNYEGPCAGTCAACDAELLELENLPGTIKYPQYEIIKDRLYSKETFEERLGCMLGYLMFLHKE